MKIFLFAILAITAVLGFSAYGNDGVANKIKSTSTTDYYWFRVDPAAGMQTDFVDADLEFLDGPLTIPNAPTDGCLTQIDNIKCVVGFRADQINISTKQLLSPNTIPAEVKSYRENP